jgi:hypothetical protein
VQGASAALVKNMHPTCVFILKSGMLESSSNPLPQTDFDAFSNR